MFVIGLVSWWYSHKRLHKSYTKTVGQVLSSNWKRCKWSNGTETPMFLT